MANSFRDKLEAITDCDSAMIRHRATHGELKKNCLWFYDIDDFVYIQCVSNGNTAVLQQAIDMMVSWLGNVSRITGHLWGESHRSPIHSCHQEPVMWNFGLFYVVNLDRLFNKQPSWCGSKTWRWSYDVTVMLAFYQDLSNVMRQLHAYIDGLVQERRNSSALAMVLRLSCTNPSIWYPRH